MQTHHRIIIGNATRMAAIADGTVDLVVTSPPYPMIQMWDEIFCAADPAIKKLLSAGDGDAAFERMHRILDQTWKEVSRATHPGSLVCINIGDATRSIGKRFSLFGNHARIISAFRLMGFHQLPSIIWRKATNAPNKFMGSGMYPTGAYVTLEHEYILIFRQGAVRTYQSDEQKRNRRESAFFWEERNAWFSDIWFDLVGTRQATHHNKSRDRSGAFPFELPYRLIHMFSVKGDLVLDPFIGTGTTMLAAMASARNSIGYEIDGAFKQLLLDKITGLPRMSDQALRERLKRHEQFIRDRIGQGKEIKYCTRCHKIPVITRQEQDLCFDQVDRIQSSGNDEFKVSYRPMQVDPALTDQRAVSEHRNMSWTKKRTLKQ